MLTPSQRRVRTLAWGAVPLVALAAALNITTIPGTNVSLAVPYAAEGPGPMVNTLGEVDGTEVVEVTSNVKDLQVEQPSGNLNMTTVSVRTNMTLAQVLGRWLTTDDTIVPLDTVIPTGKSEDEVQEENLAAFTQSESAATVSAMHYLGRELKVEVVQPMEGSPAAGKVETGDIVTAIDGQAVSEPTQAQELVRKHAPGEELVLEVERDGTPRTIRLTLGEHPEDKKTALLGIIMTSQPKDDVQVEYNLQDIGGPSAGMMFALSVIDKLSPGDLTGGKFVAGTGTIAEDGTVGPIGGIVHKVAAAKQGGAELFLSPAENCKEAVSRDTGNMVVAKVSTLDDAIAAIEAFKSGTQFPTCG